MSVSCCITERETGQLNGAIADWREVTEVEPHMAGDQLRPFDPLNPGEARYASPKITTRFKRAKAQSEL